MSDSLAKTPAYRSRKLLDLAHRVHECQMQLPGICVGYSVDGCEPSHSNSSKHGKGMGIKASDVFAVPSCRACHVAYDRSCAGRAIVQRYWLDGFARTIALYFLEGWIGVLK